MSFLPRYFPKIPKTFLPTRPATLFFPGPKPTPSVTTPELYIDPTSLKLRRASKTYGYAFEETGSVVTGAKLHIDHENGQFQVIPVFNTKTPINQVISRCSSTRDLVFNGRLTSSGSASTKETRSLLDDYFKKFGLSSVLARDLAQEISERSQLPSPTSPELC